MNVFQLRLDEVNQVVENEHSVESDLISEISDLRKVREALNAELEQETAVYCQRCDVAARLCETSNITKYKVDCCINKINEAQQRNVWLQDKINDFTLRSDEERKRLINSVSDWGKRMTECSVQLKDAAQLYNVDMESQIKAKLQEKECLKLKLLELQQMKDDLLKQAHALKQLEDDESRSSNVLQQNIMHQIFEMIEETLKNQSTTIEEMALESKLKGMQQSIST